jgi:hypothetical protein
MNKEDIRLALDRFLAEGKFVSAEDGARISFPVEAVDRFVAELGFEARVVLRDAQT